MAVEHAADTRIQNYGFSANGLLVLPTSGLNDSGSDRELTDMPHRVLSAMHEAADHRRRQLRPSDAAKLAERRRIDPSQLGDRGIDTLRQGRQCGCNA